MIKQALNGVNCEIDTCKYNTAGCACTAKEIEVKCSTKHEANKPQESQCSTFVKQ